MQTDENALIEAMARAIAASENEEAEDWDGLYQDRARAAHTIAKDHYEQRIEAERNTIKRLTNRGAELLIAYHAAICSPKGVVPLDEFYDPMLANRMNRDMDHAIRNRSSKQGDQT